MHELNIYKDISFEVLDLTSKVNTDYLFKKYRPNYFSHLASQSSVVKGTTHEALTKENEIIRNDNRQLRSSQT